MIYVLLDIFFLVFHLMLVMFVLTGWLWRKTRCLHLSAVLLVLASWFLLGLWYGIGYCPLTDWHWQVLNKLGHRGLPSSYIAYLVQRFTRYTPPEIWVDAATAGGAFLALVLSIAGNIRDRRAAKSNRDVHID